MSKALVRQKRHLPVFDEGLPEDCRRFLELFVELRFTGQACRMLGISRNCIRRWSGQEPKHGIEVPGFAAAYEIALQDVRDQEYDLLGEDNELGIKEVMYDADGKLKYTRYKQSEGLRKMRLMALDPDRYVQDRDGGGVKVQINIVMADE